jgi:hypothetical protein
MKTILAAVTAAGLMFAGSALAAEDQAPDAAAAPDPAAGQQVQEPATPSASEEAPAEESGAINQDESKDSSSKY